MANLIVKWEDIKYTPKTPSTIFENGWFISYDGSGGVVPATPAAFYGTATPILGAILENVTAGDIDYDTARPVPFQKAENNEFLVAVIDGPADASMIGSRFDVDGTNPGAVNVGASGTQLEITAVLGDGLYALVEVCESEPQA